MGIKWNPDFDRKAFAPSVPKRGLKQVAPIKRTKRVYTEGITPGKLAAQARAARRDFIFPGALVRLVGRTADAVSAKYCTVISLSEWSSSSAIETMKWGKLWEVILPDGRGAVVHSVDMRPIDLQNGNTEEEEDVGGEEG